jgi:ADP-heptose:LPS heptosyltransferase
VDFYVLDAYAGLARLAPGIDRVFPVSPTERRRRSEPPSPERHGYFLRGGAQYELIADLYCPAFRHEMETLGRPVRDRIECFCGAAGVDPALKTPELRVTREAAGWAAGWLQARGVEPGRRPLVAIQPYSSSTWRDWPADEWRALGRELERLGARVVSIHSHRRGMERMPGALATRLEWPSLAALVRSCGVLVSGDSGLFHLAAAVGVRGVGLFGPTGGRLIAKHYPLADVVTAADYSGLRCDPPCHVSPARGFNGFCRGGRCPAMERIERRAVLERVLRALAASRLERSGCDD